MIFIGIDPGQKGAVAFICNKEVFIYDMPILNKHTDVLELKLLFEKHYQKDNYCVIEAIRLQKMNIGVTSFLISYGMILGLLDLLGIAYNEVFPFAWKKSYKLINQPKSESIKMAQRLYSYNNYQTPKGRLLDGRAEALLLADYAKMLHKIKSFG